MPEIIYLYINALVYCDQVRSCVAISEFLLACSHDGLTRMLWSIWSAEELFHQVRFDCFPQLEGGYLLLDDSVIEKPYASCLFEAGFHYSSKSRRVVFGIPVVLLVWSDGIRRVPLGFKVYRKGENTKTQLALELFSEARNRFGLNPAWVLFDSWYASKKILKRLKDYGWYFITQLKKNRCFNQTQLKEYRKHPYFHEIGRLNGGMKVLLVRHRKKFFATNRLTLEHREVRGIYKKRQIIENVFAQLKTHLSLERCQVGYRQRNGEAPEKETAPQTKHIALCITAFVILEKEAFERNTTFYKIKQALIFRKLTISIPDEIRSRAYA